MNETDQKTLETPALGPWDGSGRDHASDLEDDLDTFVESTDRDDGGKG